MIEEYSNERMGKQLTSRQNSQEQRLIEDIMNPNSNVSIPISAGGVILTSPTVKVNLKVEQIQQVAQIIQGKASKSKQKKSKETEKNRNNNNNSKHKKIFHSQQISTQSTILPFIQKSQQQHQQQQQQQNQFESQQSHSESNSLLFESISMRKEQVKTSTNIITDTSPAIQIEVETFAQIDQFAHASSLEASRNSYSTQTLIEENSTQKQSHYSQCHEQAVSSLSQLKVPLSKKLNSLEAIDRTSQSSEGTSTNTTNMIVKPVQPVELNQERYSQEQKGFIQQKPEENNLSHFEQIQRVEIPIEKEFHKIMQTESNIIQIATTSINSKNQVISDFQVVTSFINDLIDYLIRINQSFNHLDIISYFNINKRIGHQIHSVFPTKSDYELFISHSIQKQLLINSLKTTIKQKLNEKNQLLRQSHSIEQIQLLENLNVSIYQVEELNVEQQANDQVIIPQIQETQPTISPASISPKKEKPDSDKKLQVQPEPDYHKEIEPKNAPIAKVPEESLRRSSRKKAISPIIEVIPTITPPNTQKPNKRKSQQKTSKIMNKGTPIEPKECARKRKLSAILSEAFESEETDRIGISEVIQKHSKKSSTNSEKKSNLKQRKSKNSSSSKSALNKQNQSIVYSEDSFTDDDHVDVMIPETIKCSPKHPQDRQVNSNLDLIASDNNQLNESYSFQLSSYSDDPRNAEEIDAITSILSNLNNDDVTNPVGQGEMTNFPGIGGNDIDDILPCDLPELFSDSNTKQESAAKMEQQCQSQCEEEATRLKREIDRFQKQNAFLSENSKLKQFTIFKENDYTSVTNTKYFEEIHRLQERKHFLQELANQRKRNQRASIRDSLLFFNQPIQIQHTRQQFLTKIKCLKNQKETTFFNEGRIVRDRFEWSGNFSNANSHTAVIPVVYDDNHLSFAEEERQITINTIVIGQTQPTRITRFPNKKTNQIHSFFL